MRIEDLERKGFICNRLSKNWYLVRLYANKKALKHVVFPMYIKGEKDGQRNRY